jgi:adenine-specific DNA-methyltransferase
MARSYDDLTKEELVRLLQARDRRDATKFGLVWEANEVERDKALNDDFVTLDLDPALSCGQGPWENLIIEGDNFDALRALKMAYNGKVKCIYIDPPYNTGNKDFVYNDRFVDREDNWRHSTWCEFMWQRLTLAKDLLKEDGIIFVSIDDNEVAPLRLIMDRIFGMDNWISTLIWKKSYGGGAKAKHVVGLHEYVLCFSQSKDSLGRISLPPNPEVLKYYKFKDSKYEIRGPYRLQPLATNSMDERPNLRYPILFEEEEIWPEKQWQWSKDRVYVALENDEIVVEKKRGKWSVNYKQYLKDESGEERGAKPYSIIEGPFTQIGTGEIKDIFGDGKTFSFPKPSGLIEVLLKFFYEDKTALVLDFFAGSGTTAHAVLKLNKEDGGNRRFILVSSRENTDGEPEKNLCRDVCAQRVRRVIEGYQDTPGTGGSFAYLRAERVEPGRMLEIDHARVWTALQLMHLQAVQPWNKAAYHWAGTEDAALLYVPEYTPSLIPTLREKVMESGAVVLYSWQPGLLRNQIRAAHVQHEGIPEALMRKFGLRRGA